MPVARKAQSGARGRLSREERVAEQRAAFAREQEKHAAGLTRARRKLCTALNFWRVCERKVCRRARGCAGDANACFVHFWPHVPEEVKIRIQAGIVARRAGGSEADMVRAGEEALARQRAAQLPASEQRPDGLRDSAVRPLQGIARVRAL